MSENLLSLYLDEYEETPWDALKYLIAGVNYGGHVTDDWDRRLLTTYIGDYFCEQSISAPLYKYGPGRGHGWGAGLGGCAEKGRPLATKDGIALGRWWQTQGWHNPCGWYNQDETHIWSHSVLCPANGNAVPSSVV